MDELCILDREHVARIRQVYANQCFKLASTLFNAVAQVEWRLHTAKRRFALAHQDARTINEQQSQCHYLDVGGGRFHTSTDVMQRHGPHLLSGLASGEFACERDCEGYVFVDRDSEWFGTILDYLREDRLWLPRSPVRQRALLREVRYFGVQEMRTLAEKEGRFAGQTVVATLGARELGLYNLHTGRWAAHRHCPGLVPWGCCGIRGRVYACTAAAGGAGVTGVAAFDVGAGSWAPVARLPEPINDKFLVMSHVAGHLVVIGEGQEGLPLVQALDVRNGRWQRLPYPFHAVGVVQANVVVAGQWMMFGATGGAAVSARGAFRSPRARWARLPATPSSSPDTVAVALRGRAALFASQLAGTPFIVGDVYDPATRTWSAVPRLALPSARRCLAAGVVAEGGAGGGGGDAIVVVTYSDWDTEVELETFSATSGTWNDAPVGIPLAGPVVSCCVVQL